MRSLRSRLLSQRTTLFNTLMAPSSSYASFQEVFSKSKAIVALSGAGISAESGVPTFRGPGGFWRTYQATNLATPEAFRADPSLVWEFYHYRREVMLSKKPNPAHYALARLEKMFKEEGSGKSLTLITQNIDELHKTAGSAHVLELHGSLFRVRCTRCHVETSNYDSPICEALRNKGAPEPQTPRAGIPRDALPSCKECGGLLRPAVVWFGENLDPDVLDKAHEAMDNCDLVLIIGTSSVVYPAAMLAPDAAERGIPVAEFNMEPTPVTSQFKFHFDGPCGSTLPKALGLEDSSN